MPVFLGCVIILTLLLSYKLNKSQKQDVVTSETFWKREQESLFVRRKDMSDLKHITLPSNLPFKETSDSKLSKIQNDIKELSECDIVNLTGLSNTDLRIKYGSPNLDYLMTCDNNYLKLAVLLNQWSSYLYEHNLIDDAKCVLEFALSTNIDISNIYTTLASIYISEHTPEKINSLKSVAENLPELTHKNVLKKLGELTKTS